MTLSSLFHLLGQLPPSLLAWGALLLVVLGAGVYFLSTRAGMFAARVDDRVSRWREQRRRTRFEARRARHFEQVHAAGPRYVEEKFAGIRRGLAELEHAPGAEPEDADSCR